MKKQNIAIFATMGVLLGVGLIFLIARRGPEKIIWDFNGGRTLSAVHWPPGFTGKVFERKGDFELTILEKGKVMFKERVHGFVVINDGHGFGNVAVRFGLQERAEDAYVNAKRIMTDWNFAPARIAPIELWHDALAKHQSLSDFQVLTRTDPAYRDMFDYPSFTTGHGSTSYRITVVDESKGLESLCISTLSF